MERPSHLRAKGGTYWDAMTSEYQFTISELSVLEDIAREIDVIEDMETDLRNSPLIVPGSMKQDTANPLLNEIRQHRSVKSALIKSLQLPEEKERKSQVQRDNVNKRWNAA